MKPARALIPDLVATLRSALVTVMVVVCAACVGQQTAPPEPDPVGVLDAWHSALVDGRPDDAYALLGPELQRQVTLEAFRILYERQKSDLVGQARSLLLHARGKAPKQHADVALGDTTVRLVHGAGGWRLTKPVQKRPDAKKAPAQK